MRQKPNPIQSNQSAMFRQRGNFLARPAGGKGGQDNTVNTKNMERSAWR
jgi:hypothetical protein